MPTWAQSEPDDRSSSLQPQVLFASKDPVQMLLTFALLIYLWQRRRHRFLVSFPFECLEVNVRPSDEHLPGLPAQKTPAGPLMRASSDGGSIVCPKTPAFRTGIVVNPKKPKAADYEDVVQALILRAAFEYEALVSTKNAFPDTALRHKWATKAWKNTIKDTEENFEMMDAISSLVRYNLYHEHDLIFLFVSRRSDNVDLAFVGTHWG
jgi:hypothetical protein